MCIRDRSEAELDADAERLFRYFLPAIRKGYPSAALFEAVMECRRKRRARQSQLRQLARMPPAPARMPPASLEG
eukprot:14112034-Heterocapsa_arctica.AAC.1